MSEYLVDSPTGTPVARYLFAHGAGAPMDSDFMVAISAALAGRGIEVLRFEFPYMAQRRHGGTRRPPNPVAQLQEDFREVLSEVSARDPRLPLFIGGKSMGGRVASLLADESYAAGNIAGLVCFGYPFHPRGKPEKLRTGHLLEMACPALVVQGSRDPLGSRQEVEGYGLARQIQVGWLEDGDHDFRPRRASGFTREGHWQAAADAAADFILGWVSRD
ncbi:MULTISPECIES: alpha/beta fold hydrolase [Microbulbifer]|uniref:alpha/beta fold hydrolase n=1 Tax=Microbulbifer TaxID=48073 RepID=UPI001E4F34EC|nr:MULTISPECIES: alpha/beta family hydrolase [Microbulbifer]UHQ56076.1 alpha/beta fold hydrolase [Microbulbifer sp. YPW16]